MDYHTFVTTARRTFLLHHLDAHGWNVSETARAIGLERTYLWALMRQMGLKRPEAGR